MEQQTDNSYPRPLVADEQELIEVLLGAAGAAGGRYLSQVATVKVVGVRGRGLPSINLAPSSGARDGSSSALVAADAESPDGTPVRVILWVRGGALSGLEVHPWDGTEYFNLPRPETLSVFRPR